MKKRIIYWTLILTTWWFIYLSIKSKNQVTESIFSASASLSLFFTIFKYFLEENKQLNEHYLNSNIVHDIYTKLIEFSDEYIKKLYETLDFLMEKWRDVGILKYAYELYIIRRKYIIYLDNTTSEKLRNFEWELRFIWANTRLLQSIPVGWRRDKIVDEIYNKFMTIINQETAKKKKTEAEKQVEKEEKISSIDEIINDIKQITWITKIINKRNELI